MVQVIYVPTSYGESAKIEVYDDPFAKRRCNYKDHVGDRMVDPGHFHSDSSRPNGLCDWCKTCSNVKKQDWRKRNVNKERDIRNIARAREAGVGWSRVDYEAVWERTYGECYLCRERVPEGKEVYDHKVPLSRGGAHVTENVGLVHSRCNTRKGKRTPNELVWKVVW